MRQSSFKHPRSGFTLIEVVLALGVFLVSVMALIGLLAPMLRSVDEIEKLDELTSVVSTVTAFLQNSPNIAERGPDPNDNSKTIVTTTKFEALYEALLDEGEATVFVYRYYDDRPGFEGKVRLEVGFSPSESAYVGPGSVVNAGDSNPATFNSAAGPIYRVVLTPSSVMPLIYYSDTTENAEGDPVPARNAKGVYEFAATYSNIDAYLEGYLALEARIFSEDPPGPSPASFDTETNLADLNLIEPDFTFSTAIVR